MKTYDILKMESVCELKQKNQIKKWKWEEMRISLDSCPYVSKTLKYNLSSSRVSHDIPNLIRVYGSPLKIM